MILGRSASDTSCDGNTFWPFRYSVWASSIMKELLRDWS